jgi:hypothetical protein
MANNVPEEKRTTDAGLLPREEDDRMIDERGRDQTGEEKERGLKKLSLVASFLRQMRHPYPTST